MADRYQSIALLEKKWDARKEGSLYLHPTLLDARWEMESHMVIFMKNMEYLLKKRGMSRNELKEWFNQVKDPPDANPVPHKATSAVSPRIYDLVCVAKFFDVPVTQMLTIDIEEFGLYDG